jgi:hypothetical protein
MRSLSGFSIRISGISRSLDIIPKPENMALRLLISVLFIAPTSGAAVQLTLKQE